MILFPLLQLFQKLAVISTLFLFHLALFLPLRLSASSAVTDAMHLIPCDAQRGTIH